MLGDSFSTFIKGRKQEGPYTLSYYKDQIESISDVIKNGGKIISGKSSYGFLPRDVEQPLFYKCVKYLSCIVYSPLVSLGSGNSPIHPEYQQIYTYRTTVQVELPKSASDLAYEGVTVEIVDTDKLVSYGDALVTLKNKSGDVVKEEVLKRWNNLMIGKLESITETVSDRTGISTYRLSFIGLIKTNEEKIRGIGLKARTTPACKFIKIYLQGYRAEEGLIFDPSVPLRDENNNIKQVEVIFSTEEAKTQNAALAQVSELLEEDKKIVFDSRGYFHNLDAGVEMLQKHIINVVVERWRIEPNTYYMLKRMYDHDKDYEFNDENKSVVHKCKATIGITQGKIEVPLTKTFYGSVPTYQDVDRYVALDHRELGDYLSHLQKQNINAVNKALTCIEESNKDSIDPEILVASSIIDERTIIREKGDQKFSSLSYRRGTNYLDEVIIPSVTVKGLRNLGTSNEALKNKKWFLFDLGYHKLLIDINTITRYMSGDTRLKEYIKSLIKRFEEPLSNRNDEWILKVLSIISSIKLSLHSYVIIRDNSLFKRMTRTTSVPSTFRIATTIDDYVKPHEVHLNPVTLETMGIELPLNIRVDKDGNRIETGQESKYIAAFSRVPVSGFAVVNIVQNDIIGPGIGLFNPIGNAACHEGDADGDNAGLVVISKETGIIKSKLPTVNILADE